MKKLLLIDGNALFYRAFYAIPPFHTSNGEMTNAIYGFIGMILTLLMKERPEYIGIAWDSKAKTFRHEVYTEYKATRKPPPEGMYEQLPRLKELLEAFCIPMFAMDGYEADDLLATLCEKLSADDLQILIASGDRDLFQIISKNIHVLVPEFGFQKYTTYTPEKVQEKFHVTAEQIVDYKSLVGDTSDNIPGVKGIGPTGAESLLQKYGTLENIYENLKDIAPKMREKLEKEKESAFFSKKIVTLEKNAPIRIDITANEVSAQAGEGSGSASPETAELLKKFKTHEFDIPKIEKIFEMLEFRSMFKKLRDLEMLYHEKRQEAQNYALPLEFD